MDTKKGQLYIGRESATDTPVLLKASSLTTHSVIFGIAPERIRRLRDNSEFIITWDSNNSSTLRKWIS